MPQNISKLKGFPTEFSSLLFLMVLRIGARQSRMNDVLQAAYN